MKTLMFTGSAHTGLQYVPLADFEFRGPLLELMDGDSRFRLPRSSAFNGPELIANLTDRLDQLMRAEVDGTYPEDQHSVLTDAIRATVDFLRLVAQHPAASWASFEGEAHEQLPPEEEAGELLAASR